MKDKSARVLAIIALVFMVIFIASLTVTLVDYKLLGGGIGAIAAGSGLFVFIVFIVLKMDGRGFSLAKMKQESELQKIEQALKDQEAEDQADTNAVALDEADAAQSQKSVDSADDN